jgi:Protein of unknown function (DUF1269)
LPNVPLVSAASGALSSDVGIKDEFMKEAGKTLQSGNAARFPLIRKMTTDKVLVTLQGSDAERCHGCGDDAAVRGGAASCVDRAAGSLVSARHTPRRGATETRGRDTT